MLWLKEKALKKAAAERSVDMAGRPLKFSSPKVMQDAIDAYFKSCHDSEGNIIKPYTITGLALALDTSRETLCNYEERDEYFDTIKRAKLKVENFAEEQMFTSKSPTGPIFALKNFGWRDTQDLNHGGQKENPLVVTAPDKEALEHYFKIRGMSNAGSEK